MLESVWKLLKELFAFRDTQKMTPKLAFLTRLVLIEWSTTFCSFCKLVKTFQIDRFCKLWIE